jgi:sterol 3beta-glucosyltransferase
MRIALTTVGTTGDVRPFAVLARALADRGHDVLVVTWPVHRAAFPDHRRLRVETAGPHADPARITAVAAEAAERTPLEQVKVLRDFHLADGEAHYRRLLDLLPGQDLVLLHGIHTLAHAAVLDAGLRWATATFDPVLLPTASAPPPGMPSLGPLNRLLWGIIDRALARTQGPLDDLLARAGSRQRGVPLFRARSPERHFVACSPAIMAVPPDLPAGTHVTGAWADRSSTEPLPSQLESFLADGPPPIAVTFGSMAGIPEQQLRSTLERLLAAGRRVVVQGAISISSPNLLTLGPVDHRALLPRTALVIHHGGAGTTHAACRAGVPSVVVPHVGDQRYWAQRLYRLGVAPSPVRRAGLDGGRLGETALAQASDPAARAAAEDLAARMAAEDGVGATVALIDRLGT